MKMPLALCVHVCVCVCPSFFYDSLVLCVCVCVCASVCLSALCSPCFSVPQVIGNLETNGCWTDCRFAVQQNASGVNRAIFLLLFLFRRGLVCLLFPTSQNFLRVLPFCHISHAFCKEIKELKMLHQTEPGDPQV